MFKLILGLGRDLGQFLRVAVQAVGLSVKYSYQEFDNSLLILTRTLLHIKLNILARMLP